MTTRENRPRSITITLLGVIVLGALSAAEAFALAQQVTSLLTLNISPDPRILFGIAVGWMVLFLGSAIALWHRWPIARWLIPLLLLLYTLYKLVLQGMYVLAPISRQSWIFRILLYDVAILFALWSLNSSKARAYFAGAQSATLVENRNDN